MTKLIRVNHLPYEKLAKYGKWSDTMDDIIARLLETGRHKTHRDEQGK